MMVFGYRTISSQRLYPTTRLRYLLVSQTVTNFAGIVTIENRNIFRYIFPASLSIPNIIPYPIRPRANLKNKSMHTMREKQVFKMYGIRGPLSLVLKTLRAGFKPRSDEQCSLSKIICQRNYG